VPLLIVGKSFWIGSRNGPYLAVNVSSNGEKELHKTMKWLGMKEEFDVGLEMSGNKDALRLMLKTMNHGGKISLLAFMEGRCLKLGPRCPTY